MKTRSPTGPYAFYLSHEAGPILVWDASEVPPRPVLPGNLYLWLYAAAQGKDAKWCWYPRAQVTPVAEGDATRRALKCYEARPGGPIARERAREAEALREQRDREARERREALDREALRRKEENARSAALLEEARVRYRDVEVTPGALTPLEVLIGWAWLPALFCPSAQPPAGLGLVVFAPYQSEAPLLRLDGGAVEGHPRLRELRKRSARERVMEAFRAWQQSERAEHEEQLREADRQRRRAEYRDAVAAARAALKDFEPLKVSSLELDLTADDVDLAITWCDGDPVAQSELQREFQAAGRSPTQLGASLSVQPGDSVPSHHWRLAQMLSARLAEKAVRSFYESHDPLLRATPGSAGRRITDMSIRQVCRDHGPFDREYDLVYPDPGDGSPPRKIDVKNARRDRRDPQGYRRHSVRKLRDALDGSAVTIVGTYVDTVRPHELLAAWGGPDFEILGETDRARVTNLEAEFRLDSLRFQLWQPEKPGCYLPPWMFEAPGFVQAPTTHMLRRLRDSHAACAEPPQLGPEELAPALAIAAGLDLSPEAWPRFSLRERELIGELLQDAQSERLSLPRLYVRLLRHFFRQHQPGTAVSIDFDAKRLRGLLYVDEAFRRPLGLLDPLQTVWNLVDSLSQFAARGAQELAAYESFEFYAAGVLKGRRPGEGAPTWMLMFTHCGRRDCSRTRLILGEDTPCLKCKKLVCRACHFCSETCEDNGRSLRERQSA